MRKLSRLSSEELPVSGYKDVGVPALAPTTPVEPLNTTSTSKRTKPDTACRRALNSTTQVVEGVYHRIPVVGIDGEPLMPTTPTRARNLLKGGQAVKAWSKLGIFYIQMIRPVGTETQDVVLGLDPGSKFDGVAVVSKRVVLQTGMLELPKGIIRKLQRRREQRQSRRQRKCRRRPKRVDNRKKKDDWIAPSQKAKVDFRLKIVKELAKLYPISKVVAEDVRFNHYRHHWGRFFSTVEIGKTLVYNTLKEWFNKLKFVEGFETAALRREYGVIKSSNKQERSINSHAVDALVIAAKEVELKELEVSSFFVWKRLQYPRRQLHRLQFDKNGVRKRYGGSVSLNGLKKGDIVLWKERLARIGGYMEGRGLSLHQFDVDNQRFTQYAQPEDCLRLFNQQLLVSAIPPRTSVTGFLVE